MLLKDKDKNWDGWEEMAKEIGRCQVTKRLRPYPTSKMGQ